MVGAVGIEPTTPSMSPKCSPAELRAPPDTGISRSGEPQQGRVIHLALAEGKTPIQGPKNREEKPAYRLYSIS